MGAEHLQIPAGEEGFGDPHLENILETEDLRLVHQAQGGEPVRFLTAEAALTASVCALCPSPATSAVLTIQFNFPVRGCRQGPVLSFVLSRRASWKNRAARVAVSGGRSGLTRKEELAGDDRPAPPGIPGVPCRD